MYDLISVYRSLNEQQRKEIQLEEDPVIEQEKLEQFKNEVDQANNRRIAEEKKYEGM